MALLLDLPLAVKRSGLEVTELKGWRENFSNGGFDPRGILIHHTGGFDDIGDTSDDLSYARWMAFEGRPPTVPPPLDNLALSAEGRVYVSCSGNANHAGTARSSGPMPAGDGTVMYLGIEAMNSGTQGWASKCRLANGTQITYYEAYVRLCASLCLFYKWPASHVRAHWETSVTGKWDPGDPSKETGRSGPDGRSMDMDKFRAAVARMMKTLKEDDMALSADDKKWLAATIEAKTEAAIDTALARELGDIYPFADDKDMTVRKALREILRQTKK